MGDLAHPWQLSHFDPQVDPLLSFLHLSSLSGMGDLAHPWQPSHFEQQLDQSMPFLR